jgi:hypothetical protein
MKATQRNAAKMQMGRINSQNYIEVKPHYRTGKSRNRGNSSYVDEWLIKDTLSGGKHCCVLSLKVLVPARFFGKRIKFKVETVEEKSPIKDGVG